MKKLARRFSALVLFLWLIPQSAAATQCLVPVGQAIGLELHNHTVTVAAIDDTLGAKAKEAGLQPGDQLLAVNDRQIKEAEDVRNALKCSNGTVQLRLLRGKKELTVKLEPAITEAGPRLGVYLKQGVTGVGTVTWYDPDTGRFGALGHGVNTSSGALVCMDGGTVYTTAITSVKRGKCGTPGQLIGTLNGAQPIGSLNKNTVQGVFGEANARFQGTQLPVGDAEDIQCGSATILSTVTGNTPQEYSVEILKVYPNSGADGRNMLLRVTDPQLLSATGGIVQGMSGSPIIQDGKLVGAVTHVLVNDPTTGYGIFIENMLDAAA